MSRPTPETDALEYEQECNFEVCWEDHARKLERERDEARELARKLRVSLELALEFFDYWDGVPMWAGMPDARDAIAKAKEVLG